MSVNHRPSGVLAPSERLATYRNFVLFAGGYAAVFTLLIFIGFQAIDFWTSDAGGTCRELGGKWAAEAQSCAVQ
jgi:hypothetical protein